MALSPSKLLEHAAHWEARAEKFAHNPRVASAMTARAAALRLLANNPTIEGTWPRRPQQRGPRR